MGKDKKKVENEAIDEQKEVAAYMKRAEHFYNALLDYLMLPNEKTPEIVVQAAFGAIEFGCVVAMQAAIKEEDFKNTVNAIWEGIKARHEYNADEESSDGEGGVSEEEASVSQPTG